MSTVVNDIAECPDAESGLAFSAQASRRPVLLALDIGSSGVRAALFDETGCAVPGAEVRVDYGSGDGIGDFATFEAETLRNRVTHAIDQIFSSAHSHARIELIAVSCFWHSLVGVDDEGVATTPVFSWADVRATDATDELRVEFDETVVHARTGCRFHPSYWPAKLRRLRKDEAAIFSKTRRWLSFADYFLFHLFPLRTTGVSLASGSGLFNLRTRNWDDELLAALGVERENLPEISETAVPVSDSHLRWPQLRDARVFPATGDGAANSIGAGCHSAGNIALMIGTSGAMRVCFAGESPDQIPPELWCYRANGERVVIGGALSDGGGLIRTLKKSLTLGAIETELQRLRPDAHGLTILPFWAGERSTGWNPRARGGIFGLSLSTERVGIVRAAMEAIAYRFALIFSKLESFAPGANVIASGNALRESPTWIQILSDVLGRRLTLPKIAEASMQGAALLALEAAGKIPSIEKFSVATEAVFEPDMTHHAIYQEGLERQQQLYNKLYGNFGVR